MKSTSEFEKRLQCLRGTFAVEDMVIAPQLRQSLKRLDAGEIACRQLVAEAKQRHAAKR